MSKLNYNIQEEMPKASNNHVITIFFFFFLKGNRDSLPQEIEVQQENFHDGSFNLLPM